MKYCPYCGTALWSGAVSFCSECGHVLPKAEKAEEREDEKREESAAAERKKSLRKEKRKRKEDIPVFREYQLIESVREQDDGYDGYYDDVRPADEDMQKEGIDTMLIRKITALAAGLLVIVSACIVLMYFL